MKYKYTKYIFLVFCFCLSGTTTFAAKTLSLRLVRVEITNNNNNCDEQCAWWTDKKMDWTFDVDDGSAGGWQTDVNEACQQMPGDNNDPGDWNANYIVWSNSYPFVCSWPSSSVGVDFRLEGWDRDCDLCVGGGFANVGGDHVCTVPVNPTFPSSAFSGTGGNLTYTCNFNSAYNGGSNCVGTITVVVRWEASGSFDAQTTDDYICGAFNMGTLGTGATLSRNNFSNIGYSTEDICAANEPNNDSNDETVWLKYKTGPNPGTAIEVDVDAIGGSGSGGAFCISGGTVFAWTRVYEGPDDVGCPLTYSTNAFSQLSQVGSLGSLGTDNSLIDIDCPKPNQTYYIQVEMQGIATCDMGRYNITVRDNGIQAGPNYICQPANSATIGVNGGWEHLIVHLILEQQQAPQQLGKTQITIYVSITNQRHVRM